MSLLPGEILPQNTPLGRIDPRTGKVLIEHNWWLLLYNLCLQVIGPNLDAVSLQALFGADVDAADSDAIVLRRQIEALAALIPIESDPPASSTDALILALDALLQDPVPAAQPVAVITVGASPFVYAARSDGVVSITSGTVSLVTITRQGTVVSTGLTAGLFPLRRLDQLTVTYSVTPTMVFLP